MYVSQHAHFGGICGLDCRRYGIFQGTRRIDQHNTAYFRAVPELLSRTRTLLTTAATMRAEETEAGETPNLETASDPLAAAVELRSLYSNGRNGCRFLGGHRSQN